MSANRAYRVEVEVHFPRVDWLDKLQDATDPEQRCAICHGPQTGGAWVYMNTECRGSLGEPGDLPRVGADLHCSWLCVLRVAASIAPGEEDVEAAPDVTVTEIPDWRNEVAS